MPSLSLFVRVLRTMMTRGATTESFMRVITRKRLREFWETLGQERAEGPLKAWYTHVANKSVAWRDWGEVKADFATVSRVGNCAIFNIGGNKFRLATRVLVPSQKVFILRVMTHAQYDTVPWAKECGCFEGPPAAKP